MKAVILAAGKGVRLQPLTNDRPKQMVEVLGRPIIDYVLELLPEEITEIIMIVGYKREVLESHLGDSRQGRKITYVIQEELKGPYAAICLAKPYLGEESFMVIFADDLYDKASIKKLLLHSRTMLVHEVSEPSRFGIVVLNGDGTIKDIEEKPANPKSSLAVTGAYVFDSHLFEYEPETHSNGEFYLPPVIMKMKEKYPVYTEKAEFWMPIGYPEDIAKAEEALRAGRINGT